MKKQTGFTLLELFIALAISAVLMVTLTAGIESVVRDWQKQNHVLDQKLDNSLALLQLERAVQASVAHGYTNKKGRKQVFFEGEKDSMIWVSMISANRQAGLTLWKLENSKQGIKVYLGKPYNRSPEDNLKKIEANLLLENYQVSFQYLTENRKKQRQWENNWSAEKERRLPLAVSMQFTPKSSQGQKLELIAAVLAQKKNSQGVGTIGTLGR